MIRAAFFLFIAADAFSNAFLPVHARGLSAASPMIISGMSQGFASGAPISAFWLMVAAAQLTAGFWERGRDHRTLLLGAMLMSSAALAMAGIAGTIEGLILWRAMGGFGYGVAMMLVQDSILRTMGPKARTQASGNYLSAFFAGTICGTFAGSEIAGLIGYSGTFLAAAAVSGCAVVLATFVSAHRETKARQPFRPLVLLRNPAFLALAVLAAVPSRLLIAGFIYFLVPLYLHDAGLSPAETARVVMIYSLILATTTLAWSRLIDRMGRPLLFTLLGLASSAAAMLVIPIGPPGIWGAIAAVVLLGTSQAMGMSPQVTVLFQIARAEMDRFGATPVLGIYRVCERAGLFAGPLVAAWVMGGHGYEGTMVALGAMAAFSVIALFAAFAIAGALHPPPDPDERGADVAPEQETVA
jgi:predicted MFS family arabinose efflux permease